MLQTEDTNDPRYMAPAVVARREQALEYVRKLHSQLLGSFFVSKTTLQVSYSIEENILQLFFCCC